ncbi:adenosylcobinamide-GDP ribazoletransferase [Thalassotalea profundi]|uniref:Adenosylcobinamide-GDP ribazoletransferase n=2 Tax=Thalassotalea profundi TaxID=2036687 RepID=A0ABQ3ISU1_9GAMM|nr:adenosylcobinamide-GDP ribazoletransferase [Thalassotalea profundi]
MNHANRYFPLVGFLIALFLSAIYLTFCVILPLNVSVILLVIASLLLTGAFHEDGLADMADGIGGGTTIEQRLVIMKDSRIGTYGTVTLVLSLLLKYTLLLTLANQQLLIPSLILAYTLSRALAASLIFNTTYVVDSAVSKSKPLANRQSLSELIIVVVSGGLALLVLVNEPWFLTLATAIVLVLVVFRTLFRRWLIKRLGGFTGDCLGAAQQMSELLIYLTIVAVSQHYVNNTLLSINGGIL